MNFSAEELDFFHNIFIDESNENVVDEVEQALSVKTDVPQYLKQVLVGSKLTLLAEISHYQLWFPVALSLNAQGDFLQKLSIPEIIDVRGSERSWRVSTPKNVAVIDMYNGQEIELLSLSSTGLTLKLPKANEKPLDLQHSSFAMSLAGEEPLKFELDLVRNENDMVSAKFKSLQEGRESLRKYLFNSHKRMHAHLYQKAI